MKSIQCLAEEITKNLNHVTSYESTKILVMMDKLYRKPWTNHRLELNYYSVRYKAEDKTIFIYSKPYEYDDSFDFDTNDIMEFPVDFNVKINIKSNNEIFIEKLKNNIRSWFRLCVREI